MGERAVYKIGRDRPGEGGFMAMTLLLFLSILALPLGTMICLSRESALLAKKTVFRKRSFGLAEYAVWEWIARSAMGSPGFLPGAELVSRPGPWTSAMVSGSWEGGSYEAYADARLDSGDLDRRPETAVVLYDRSFGFPLSPLGEGGYPVFDIHARGRTGLQAVGLDAAVTYTPYAPPRLAALVANGPLRLVGPVFIDGRAHASDGWIESGGEGTVGVAAAGPLELEGEVEIINADGLGDGVVALRDLLADPYAILSLPPDSRYLEKRAFGEPGALPWSGTVCFREDCRREVRGAGTLIVHNPNFDPVRYAASYDRSLGRPNDRYDAGYSHLDPANQPAALEPAGDSYFRGLIIADTMRPAAGRLEVTGQIFILSPLETATGMSGGLYLRYSRQALRENAHGDCDLLLSWKPASGG